MVEVVDRYLRMSRVSDATIAALDIDAPGHVPWWPRPDVKLFNIMVHALTETNRHVGMPTSCASNLTARWEPRREAWRRHGRDATFWENHRARSSGQPWRPMPPVGAPTEGEPMPSSDEIRDGQRAAWAGLSAGWEKWDSVIMEQLGPVGAAMIEHLDIADSQQHLDIAAGTGEPGLSIADCRRKDASC